MNKLIKKVGFVSTPKTNPTRGSLDSTLDLRSIIIK